MTVSAYPYRRYSSGKQGQGNSLARQGEPFEALCNRQRWLPDYSLGLDDKGKSAYHGVHVKKGRLGFFLAAALNFTVGASFGWRAMFLCGGAPVFLALYMLSKLKESDQWVSAIKSAPRSSPLRRIFEGEYLRRTLVNSALVTISIIGLWAAAVYEPSAIVTLAKKAGHSAPEAARLASFGTGLLSIGTCLGCLAVPVLAERVGRLRGDQSFRRRDVFAHDRNPARSRAVQRRRAGTDRRHGRSGADHVRQHAVAPLSAQQAFELCLGTVDIQPSAADGNKAAIPKPLVGV